MSPGVFEATSSKPAVGLGRGATLLHGIDLRATRGAEIGPLHNPLVDRDAADVLWVDHGDTEALRRRWADDPAVDVSLLHVDAVWGRQTLAQALSAALHARGDAGPVAMDYVLASHVIEHVPDLVTWLAEVAAVLRRRDRVSKSGRLRLAVPDKRYCFDFLRRTTQLSEVLEAFARRRRAPAASRVLDFALNMVHVDYAAAWRGEIDERTLVHGYTAEQALALARDAEDNGTYHDVHCWVFTPASFAALMLELARIGCMPLACEWITRTERDTYEFYASMVLPGCADDVESSWTMALAMLEEGR